MTLWTAPEENREFTKAVNENRVVTVIHQNAGTKPDYGLVGFVKKPFANFLVFPRMLGYPAETKIIGIKYEQIAEEKPKGPLYKPSKEIKPGIPMREKRSDASAPERDLPQRRRPEPPPKPVPRLSRFRAEIKIVATQIVPVEIEASTASEAAKLIGDKLASAKLDLSAASIKKTASKPKKIARPR